MRYLLAGKNRCKHLVVGITNPDPLLTKFDETDKARSSREANPLTYFERYSIVKLALKEAGVSENNFSIVPFPINYPELYAYYVSLNASFYLTIYDPWGEKKLHMFKSLGLTTEILWQKNITQKRISGKDVRRRIVEDGEWTHLVPKTTAEYIKTNNIRNRLLG